MKVVQLGLLVIAFASVVPAQSPDQQTCKVVLHIDGFRNQKGAAGVTVFKSPDGWPEDNSKAFLHTGHPFSGSTATIKLQLPPGHYAFAALHDENSNHKLDRNFVGWPKEGFGFTNNPKVGLTAPSFESAATNVRCPVTETTIHLIYK